MRFHALACDYDGTLALNGRVDSKTVAALKRLLATGRKLILVTGRDLDELLGIFPEITLFEWVVAENGALLYRPADRTKKLFGESPSNEFVDRLRQQSIPEIAIGHVIVATWHPYETIALEVIKQMGLDLQVIFNKDAVMILPAGINKASGLRGALKQLELSTHEVVGIGDAENDHAFLSICECSVAVANALPSVKERVDLVTKGDHGAGVIELIDLMESNDLEDLYDKLVRHHLLLGTRTDGAEVRIPPYGLSVLVCGPSERGKCAVCTTLVQRFAECDYQYCIIDSEGNYEALSGAIAVGSATTVPSVDEVLQLLKDAATNVVVNLVGLPPIDRPTYFLSLLPRLQQMREHTGRPHWIIVNETHRLLPTSWIPEQMAMPRALKRMVFVTEQPDQVSPTALSAVDLVLAAGKDPEKSLGSFCGALGVVAPRLEGIHPREGEVVAWPRSGDQAPFSMSVQTDNATRDRT